MQPRARCSSVMRTLERARAMQFIGVWRSHFKPVTKPAPACASAESEPDSASASLQNRAALRFE
eukprot:6487645-Lingulodinium_polyedra.AAC.1